MARPVATRCSRVWRGARLSDSRDRQDLQGPWANSVPA
jgi:hypothetical protein